MPKHSTDGVSPFANPQISDETATAWADRTDVYVNRVLSIGVHRSDVLGYEFDYDTLTLRPVE